MKFGTKKRLLLLKTLTLEPSCRSDRWNIQVFLKTSSPGTFVANRAHNKGPRATIKAAAILVQSVKVFLEAVGQGWRFFCPVWIPVFSTPIFCLPELFLFLLKFLCPDFILSSFFASPGFVLPWTCQWVSCPDFLLCGFFSVQLSVSVLVSANFFEF